MFKEHRLTLGLGVLAVLCSVGGACSSDGPETSRPGTPAAQPPIGTTPSLAGSQAPAPIAPVTPTPTTAGPATQPPTVMGAAGSAATMPPMAAEPPGTMPPDGNTTMPMAGAPMAMDECGLHTKYAGDEYCILPPPPDKGFQLHIGPSNYDNPEPQYILAAHQEITSDFSATSSNDKQQYFYYRQFRMRTGAHHNIITSGSGGDTGLGQRIGTVNALSEDYPKGAIIAEENKGVGISINAKTRINVSLHSINVTDQTQLREVWVNFWYRNPEDVTDPVKEMFQPAPQSPILPGADVTFGGSCTVQGTGRMLWMYGHRHANNVRFSAWRVRGTQKDLIYQGYNWEETLQLEYSSTVKNAVPDTAPGVEGGWSGILDVKTGDRFEWECHVINQTDGTLLFTNNTFTGEMCILDAELVGGNCP